MIKIPFKKANILLPKKTNMEKWSVVACDQYTSQPEYWNDVKKIIGDDNSTYNLILPEIYLEDSDVENRIKSINKNMDELLKNDFFEEYKDSLIYIERTQKDGLIREGVIGMIDLEDYSYEKGSTSLVRATEKTVIERIPPRVKVRENASLELPHIMILIDDDKKDIIESLKEKVSNEDKLYDFDLMKDGGHIKGYLLKDKVSNEVIEKLGLLADKEYFNKKYNIENKEVLLFAMGDGNHSLATAKACYEKLKKEIGDKALLNPARYALVELVNLHSNALEFEAIHRVLFNVDTKDLLKKLYEYYDIKEEKCDGQKITYVTHDEEKDIYITNPKSNLTVGSLQIFLDEYLEKNDGKIDYVHGSDVVKKLSKEKNNIGFILPVMKKDELFKTVILDGALPRKTFSMGHSNDKRYYLEARRIK